MITIFEADKIKREDIFARNEPAAEVSGTVREIINNVRINGDKALSGYFEKFDKVKLSDFKVSKEEIKMSAKKVEPEFLDILKEAEANIRALAGWRFSAPSLPGRSMSRKCRSSTPPTPATR